MSRTSPIETSSAFARAARAFTKATADRLSVKPRSADPVRRDTYDIDDDRARIHAPLGDGTMEDMHDNRDALMEALEQAQRETANDTRYGQGIITRAQIAVIRVMLYDDQGFDWYSGTNDLAESQLAEKSGTSLETVKATKRRAAALGIFDWLRRSVRTGLPRLFGVAQRIPTSNLYFFTLDRLCPEIANRFRAALARRRVARCLRERKAGTEGRRQPLVRRERRPLRVPARLNPRLWAAALRAVEKAKATAAAIFAEEQARAVAYATELARTSHPKPI